MIALMLHGETYEISGGVVEGGDPKVRNALTMWIETKSAGSIGYSPDTDLSIAFLLASEFGASMIDLSKHKYPDTQADGGARAGVVH